VNAANRLALLEKWIAERHPGRSFKIEPASTDASFRRYFRIFLDGLTQIAMDAPPEKEDCRPFIKVASLMREADVHVPEILASDLTQGFLLLTDLGNETYLNALNADNADTLFGDAIDALVMWQLASREGVLPAYDEALLRRELNLFPDWYVARHLKVELTPPQHRVLEEAFARILESNLAQPTVFVHRDFMPRNLMLSDPNPGVLDFQDAVYGPIGYDIACLTKDAFISWDEERVLEWTIRYWEKARKAGLPVPQDFAQFHQECEWMALQRHLKVAGIFARINYRDGKPHYLTDTPRFIGYIRGTCERYRDLRPLARLIEQLEGTSPKAGYTF
jgi:N-acetylmuramate 1-kinase